jgi:hypothetical protein
MLLYSTVFIPKSTASPPKSVIFIPKSTQNRHFPIKIAHFRTKIAHFRTKIAHFHIKTPPFPYIKRSQSDGSQVGGDPAIAHLLSDVPPLALEDLALWDACVAVVVAWLWLTEWQWLCGSAWDGLDVFWGSF